MNVQSTDNVLHVGVDCKGAEIIGNKQTYRYSTLYITTYDKPQFFCCVNQHSITSVCLSVGLSHLVSASYTEDSYGVVQSSLPGLVTVLLDTLEVSALLM